MRIEEAIQQKRSFRNAHHKALVNLIYTHNWVTDKIQQHLKPYGITMKQYNVLRILRGSDKPVTTSVIRERLLDKMSDTSRMVKRLHDRGLVIRKECNHDRRLVDILLSPQGEQLMEQMEPFNHVIDGFLKKLSNQEAEQLSTLLDKVRSEE